MGRRKPGIRKLMASLLRSQFSNTWGESRPWLGLEKLEDRLLLTTVPAQAAIAGFANNYWIQNMKLEQAWDISTGSKGVIVADLEDGVSYQSLQGDVEVPNDNLFPTYTTMRRTILPDRWRPHGSRP